MGKAETPNTPWKQLGFTKIIFNEPEMPFLKVHPLCLGLEPLTKLVHNFLGQQKVIELNHKYLNLGI